jgi:hypothetical protein
MIKKIKDPHPIPKEHNSDRIPMSGPFTIVSILGFLISAMFTISGRFNQWFMWAGENAGNTWGFLFTLFFLMLLIASIISITPKGDF